LEAPVKRILLVAAVFALAFGLIGSTSVASASGGRDNDRGRDHGNNSGPRDPRTRDGKPKYTVRNNDSDGRHDWNREHGNQQGYSQIVREYHMDNTSPFAASVCGVNFVGTIREKQDYVLRANGKLYFKYIAWAQAEGLDSQGRGVELSLLNYEIDLIIAEEVPDLAPYNGVLADWVNDHLDIVIDVKSQFLMKVKGSTGGPKLLNNWVFHATHTGIKLDKVTFEVKDCAPFQDTVKAEGRDRDGYDRDGRDRDGRDRQGYDRDGYDRDGYDRDGCDRDGRDRQGYDRDGRDKNGRDRDGYDRDGRDRDGKSKNNKGDDRGKDDRGKKDNNRR
jgi:hypothetical protein